MPRTARATRRRSGVRLGRPPRADAGNWEKFYTLLKTDVAAYIRAKHRETNQSMSQIIADLVSKGISVSLDQEQQPEQEL